MSAAYQHTNQNRCYYNWETELHVQQNYHLQTYGIGNLRSKNRLLGEAVPTRGYEIVVYIYEPKR